MITLELPVALEKHFWDVVRSSYHGDLQAAMVAFLKLHERYGWKEQLRTDVKSIRAEVRRRGGVKEEIIEDAINRYRKSLGVSGDEPSACGD